MNEGVTLATSPAFSVFPACFLVFYYCAESQTTHHKEVTKLEQKVGWILESGAETITFLKPYKLALCELAGQHAATGDWQVFKRRPN